MINSEGNAQFNIKWVVPVTNPEKQKEEDAKLKKLKEGLRRARARMSPLKISYESLTFYLKELKKREKLNKEKLDWHKTRAIYIRIVKELEHYVGCIDGIAEQNGLDVELTEEDWKFFKKSSPENNNDVYVLDILYGWEVASKARKWIAYKAIKFYEPFLKGHFHSPSDPPPDNEYRK